MHFHDTKSVEQENGLDHNLRDGAAARLSRLRAGLRTHRAGAPCGAPRSHVDLASHHARSRRRCGPASFLIPVPAKAKKCENEANLVFIFNKLPWKRTHFRRQRCPPRRRCQTPMAVTATHWHENEWPPQKFGKSVRTSQLFNFQRSVSPCRRHLTMRTAGFDYCAWNSIH